MLADRTNGQENIPEEQPRHSKRQALHILKEAVLKEAAEIKQKPRGDSASGGGTRWAKVKLAPETESACQYP